MKTSPGRTILYGSLGKSKLQFFIKNYKFISGVIFFHFFGHQNLGSGSGSRSVLKRMRIRNTGKNTSNLLGISTVEKEKPHNSLMLNRNRHTKQSNIHAQPFLLHNQKTGIIYFSCFINSSQTAKSREI
jgi:hypothetical protein